MYIILSYDVEEERVNKICSYLKRWLFWRQNSIFEGELSDSQYFEMIKGLESRIDKEKDSVYVYILPSKKNLKFKVLGIEKRKMERVI